MHPQKLLKKVGQGELEVRDLTKRELRDLHSMLRTVGPHDVRPREDQGAQAEEPRGNETPRHALRKFLKEKMIKMNDLR